jgi:acetyl-CoA acetyltransferase family protein
VPEVVVVDAVRTPIGRGDPERGAFRDAHPNELLGACFTALLERCGLEPALVDDVICGCVQQYGEQGLNVARNAWLQAGLPETTPAATVDRQCGSGQQAVNFAAALIASGAAEVVVAGGVEHMGHLPLAAAARVQEAFGTPWPPALHARYRLVPQGESAELIAERWHLGREALDAYALRSHRRAAAARASGRFDAELVAVGGVTADEGIREDTSAERLAGLQPAFRPDGVVTAGNASQISDGAAAVLLASAARAEALGLPARARIVGQATVGVDPVMMLTGPIPATRRLLDRAGLGVDDVDRFEVNEAFASVPLAWLAELGADPERVNVNGGAIALGHPLGASGARLVATLVHELEREGLRRGVVAICCGGGLGTGTLLERP